MSLRCEGHRLLPRAAIERFQEWVYHTHHPVEACLADDYFLPANDRLLRGDVIDVYAVGRIRTHHMRFLVARSERETVVVTPFAPAYEIDGYPVQAARIPKSCTGSALPRNSGDLQPTIELVHQRHDSYRIIDASGDVLIGDVRGHQFAVSLFGRLQAGTIALREARRVAEGVIHSSYIDRGVSASGAPE